MNKLLRLILTLVLGAFALLFAISLLVATLVFALLGALKALITGKKPTAPKMLWRFKQFSAQDVSFRNAAPAEPSHSSRVGDVVDVEVREIRHENRLP